MANSIKDVTGRDSKTRPDPLAIIEKYYTPGTKSYEYIILRGRMVADKALAIAENVTWLPPGMAFIEEASLLHDIGIFMCDAPHLGCTGDYPYIAHGYLGRQILEDEGCPLHALVCERHVGMGLTKAEIIEKQLPVPAPGDDVHHAGGGDNLLRGQVFPGHAREDADRAEFRADARDYSGAWRAAPAHIRQVGGEVRG